MTVPELLAGAREAHLAYREALPRRVSSGGSTVRAPGDAQVAKAMLALAYRLRLEAELADPDGADPAWLAESVHYPLLVFYNQKAAN